MTTMFGMSPAFWSVLVLACTTVVTTLCFLGGGLLVFKGQNRSERKTAFAKTSVVVGVLLIVSGLALGIGYLWPLARFLFP